MPFSVPVLPASGPRVQLRGWRDDDLDAFAALDADAEAGYWLGGPFDRAASRARMAAIRARLDGQGFGFWALELPGVAPFIGCAGLNRPGFAAPFLPAVEIGWRLARPYQRQPGRCSRMRSDRWGCPGSSRSRPSAMCAPRR